MICNKCGTQNNENSKFCVGCGNSLAQDINNIQNLNIPSIQNNTENLMVNQQISPVINEQIMPVQPNNNTSVNEQMASVENTKKEKKPINKKILFIILGAVFVVIVVGVVLLLLLGGNKESKKLSKLFDLEQPIPVYKDGGYVYIDTNGKIMKSVKYNEASDFNGDYAFVELQDGTAALIDKSQNVKVSATSYYGMEYISAYDIWLIDGVLYNNKLNAITDKSLNLSYLDEGFFTYNNEDFTEYGVMDSKGKKVYTDKCLITSLDINSYNDEYYAILETTCYENNVGVEKEYLISLQTGKVLYENEYKATHQDSYYYYLLQADDYNMFYIVDDNYDKIKYFYLKDDKVFYSSTENLYGLDLFGENYLRLDYGYDYDEIGKEERYEYYNLKTKKIENEEPKLEQIDVEIKVEKDITKRQIVSCSNGKGLIDDKNVIIPCIYNDVSYLDDNVHDYIMETKSMDLVIVEDSDDKISIYDANDRKEIIKFEDSEKSDIIDYKNSLFIVQKIYVDDSWFSDLEKVVVYNLLTGDKLMFDSKSDINIKLNYFTASKDGKKVYYNMNFEKIYTEN